MDELKRVTSVSEVPCPFCGEISAEAPDDCVCQNVLMSMSRGKWNHRPIEDALRAELEQVKQAAIAQSEEVQRDWLSPIEANGLRAELARVTAERDRMREAVGKLVQYRAANTLNFQLEKLDDYLRAVEAALEETK